MIRTIIIDDEILTRVGIQSLLDNLDDVDVVHTFEYAKEALEYLKENHVDIIITDIEMHDMSGLEFIKQLRIHDFMGGIIILSCHDNFNYAKEAISLGTDSYLLKHEVNEEMIGREIQKVYEKITSSANYPSYNRRKPELKEDKDMIYQIGVLRLCNFENKKVKDTEVETTMLISVLEEIVDKGNMGTLMVPLKKEIFVIFRFLKSMEKEDRIHLLEGFQKQLKNGIRQYFNHDLLLGFSQEFQEMKEIPAAYEDGVNALDMRFYNQSKHVPSTTKSGEQKLPACNFSSEGFWEDEKNMLFTKYLDSYLTDCRSNQIPLYDMKEKLIQEIHIFLYKILYEYQLEEALIKEWTGRSQFVSIIMEAETQSSLTENLLGEISRLKREVLLHFREDVFIETLQYISEHLTEAISLNEAAHLSGMSIPSFCKKFKERTGYTFTHYLNIQRVEQVKICLRNQKYSLGMIAEMTGFSNENYMIRVFKKITGKTIRDYRQEKAD